jgi:hypothetical protein
MQSAPVSMGEDTSGVASCMFRVTRVDKSTWWGATGAGRVRRWKWGHAARSSCGGKDRSAREAANNKTVDALGPPRACLVCGEVDVTRVEDAVVVGV